MNRSVLWIAGGFLALHLGLAAVLPLISDETYYALWSSGLDWDYYDHPPMIAAMIRAGVEVFGYTPFGIRVVAMLAMAATSLLVAAIAGLMTEDEAPGPRAALYFNLGFLALGVGSFASPDVPSTLFWALATFAAMRATEDSGEDGRLGWWVLAGIGCGLGVMSKFTNLFLMVGFTGWLIFTRAGRAQLLRTGPWLAILSAALVVAPLILWNISHHGLGFERQFSRIAATGISLNTFAQYFVILVLLPTPLLGVFAVTGLARWQGRGRALLLWSVAPLLAYFALHALHGAVEVNWPMPATIAMAVLAAGAAPRFGEGWRRAAVGSGAVLSFGLLALLFNPWRPLNAVDSPANQIRGWDAAIPEIATAAKEAQVAWIATRDYGLTGRLWLGLAPLPVFSVTEPQRWGFRGGFPQALCDLPGLLVESKTDDPALASQEFGTVGPQTEVARQSAGVTLRTYRLRPVANVLDKALCPGAG